MNRDRLNTYLVEHPEQRADVTALNREQVQRLHTPTSGQGRGHAPCSGTEG